MKMNLLDLSTPSKSQIVNEVSVLECSLVIKNLPNVQGPELNIPATKEAEN